MTVGICFCLLTLHCTAERVIYSMNIGEIAANTQIPAQLKTFDGGTLVWVNQENASTYKEMLFQRFKQMKFGGVDIGQDGVNIEIPAHTHVRAIHGVSHFLCPPLDWYTLVLLRKFLKFAQIFVTSYNVWLDGLVSPVLPRCPTLSCGVLPWWPALVLLSYLWPGSLGPPSHSSNCLYL